MSSGCCSPAWPRCLRRFTRKRRRTVRRPRTVSYSKPGLVGGNSACSGRYVGINGRVAGPVSLYGMVETYRCTDRAGSANRIGAAVLLGRSSWIVRPALRAGIEHRGGDDVWPTAGVSLTLGRRYGARSIFHVGDESGGTGLRFQMGGYVSF